ncbi:hypothetical protein B0T24DRAFT_218933 [Lasiosphaeria ovina]|uniref:Uncharacterized protein n=1 Tax=Lasiosphaeria ovina TaxID=92902 RepID=A0AAE0KH22_9PEZI|nr:hypothetical protein B0T24DRAFT_218933 [Lasiosphaeria ovina]
MGAFPASWVLRPRHEPATQLQASKQAKQPQAHPPRPSHFRLFCRRRARPARAERAGAGMAHHTDLHDASLLSFRDRPAAFSLLSFSRPETFPFPRRLHSFGLDSRNTIQFFSTYHMLPSCTRSAIFGTRSWWIHCASCFRHLRDARRRGRRLLLPRRRLLLRLPRLPRRQSQRQPPRLLRQTHRPPLHSRRQPRHPLRRQILRQRCLLRVVALAALAGLGQVLAREAQAQTQAQALRVLGPQVPIPQTPAPARVLPVLHPLGLAPRPQLPGPVPAPGLDRLQTLAQTRVRNRVPTLVPGQARALALVLAPGLLQEANSRMRPLETAGPRPLPAQVVGARLGLLSLPPGSQTDKEPPALLVRRSRAMSHCFTKNKVATLLPPVQ